MMYIKLKGSPLLLFLLLLPLLLLPLIIVLVPFALRPYRGVLKSAIPPGCYPYVMGLYREARI